jgi:hypothetical protein
VLFSPNRFYTVTELDIGRPTFTHLLNNRIIDDYLKLLADEGHSGFKYRILDINLRILNLIVVQ